MFLVIRIHHDRSHQKIYLSQKSFISDLLNTWNMSSCHPLPIPLRQKLHELPSSPPNSLPDIKNDNDIKLHFQHLVGSLIYLAVCTCPDIAYVVMALSQYNASLTRAHVLAAKGVLQYLAGTADLSLEFGMEQSAISAPVCGFAHCCAITDADWATDEKDQQSILGYCFYFLNSLISWSSTKQKTISLSSTESEYYVMTHALKEALWIRLFSLFIGFWFLDLSPSLRQPKCHRSHRIWSCVLSLKTYWCSLPLHTWPYFQRFLSNYLDTYKWHDSQYFYKTSPTSPLHQTLWYLRTHFHLISFPFRPDGGVLVDQDSRSCDHSLCTIYTLLFIPSLLSCHLFHSLTLRLRSGSSSHAGKRNMNAKQFDPIVIPN